MNIKSLILLSLGIAAGSFIGHNVQAATAVKQATGTDLTGATAGVWSGGTGLNGSPGASDMARWTNSSLGAKLTLGTSVAWGGVNVSNALTDVYIGGAGTLTNGANGIDLTASSVNLTITNPVVLGASQTWNVNSGLGVTNYGGVSSAYGLTKAGLGTVNLHGANAITAAITVSSGVLAMSSVTTTTTNVITVSGGATFQSYGTLSLTAGSSNPSIDVTGAGSIALVSTSNSAGSPDIYFCANDTANSTANWGCRIAAPINLGNTQRFIWGNTDHNSVDKYGLTEADCQFAGAISGSGGLTFVAQDSNTGGSPMETPFCLNAANTFTGPVVIQRGSVYLGAANAFPSGNQLSFNVASGNAGKLFLYGQNITVANLSSTGAGTALIADGNRNPSSIGPATLTVSQNISGTFAGAIVDTNVEYAGSAVGSTTILNLVKTGSATLTLAGNNSYSGTTTINNGTLLVNGSIMSSVLTVATNGILGGTGSIGGPVTVNGGGSLAPGDATGTSTLTVRSLALGSALNNGITINYSANPTGVLGLLNVTNSNGLTNNGAVTVQVSGTLPITAPAVYTLIQYAGSLKGSGTFAVGSLPNAATGYITNNTGASAIQLVVTSVNIPAITWVGAPLNNWDQLGSNVWVQTGTATPANYADGDLVTFNDTTSNYLVNVPVVVTPISVLVSNSASDYLFMGNGGIAGYGLTKQGSARLILSTTNTYTGNTTISAGAVVLANSAAIPGGSGAGNVIANGTVDVNGFSPTFNNLSGTGVVDNVAAGGTPVLTTYVTGSSTFGGTIQNSTGLLELNTTGGGTTILTGSNTYSGGTVINSGTLQVGAGGNSGTVGTAAVVDNATLAFNRSDISTFPNDILGSGSVQQNGSGTVILTGNASYAGPTLVNAGVLDFASKVTFDVSSGTTLSVAANAVAQTAGELDLRVNASSTATDASGSGVLQLVSTLNQTAKIPDIFFGVNHSATSDYGCRLAVALNLGASQRTIYGLSGRNDVARYGLTGADCQFANTISGSGQLTLVGQNSWAGVNTMEVPFVFNASNSFSGPLEIQRGSVYLGNANALTMGNVLILDPAASMNSRLFLYGFNASVADLQSANYGSAVIADGNNVTTVNVGPATLTVTQNNPETFGGVLCDWYTEYTAPTTGSLTPQLSLIKNGPAALTLTGANTYSGTTAINAGKLYVNGTSSGTGSITVSNGATLGGNGIISSTNIVVMAGGTIETGGGTGNGNLQLSVLNLGVNSGDTSVLNLAATAQLNVTNANGLSIQSGAGAVTVNVSGSISSVGVFPLITYRGTLSGTGYSAFQLGSLPPGAIGVLSNDVANVSVDLVVSRVTIPRWTGNLSSEWSTNVLATPKNWVLNDDGVTAIDYINGEIVRFDDSAANTTVNIGVANVAPISITFSNLLKNYTVAGNFGITGSTALLKQGTGKLTLSTTNSYTGTTTIAAGVLSLGTGTAIPGGSSAGNVVVNGTLDLAGQSAAINNLAGSGIVDDLAAGGTPMLTVTVSSNLVFSGTIRNTSGTLGLTLLGGGSLTLSGTNTYGGATTVSNSTLIINGSIGAGNLTVQNGATLAGVGTVNGPCSLAAGSTLNLTANAPLAVGALAVNGTVTVNVSGTVSATNSATYVLMNHGARTGSGTFSLAPIAGLFSSSFTASLLDTNNQLQLVVSPAKPTGTIADVRHVIIFMQENRSFDHYFGSLHGVHGFSDRNALMFQNGSNVFYQPSGASYELPFHTTIQCISDLSHGWSDQHQALDAGKCDQWVAAKTAETMAFLNRSDLPYYYGLADAYTICDEYHCSTATSTDPNRLYLWTGMIDPNDTGGGPVIDNTEPANGWGSAWVTYPELLQKAGISWKVFQQSDNYDDNALAWFSQYKQAQAGNPLYDNGIATVTSLATALQNAVVSNTLPSVSWVVAPASYSEHPDYSPASGESLTKQLLDAVASNPAVYNSTVFILLYDENDGFFDHEIPIIPPTGTPNEFVSSQAIGLGPRVPMILVSPWTRGGYVNSQIFDATSVSQFLETWTGVKNPNISAWRRQVCGNLVSAFNFTHPNTNYPSLTAVSAISCGSGTTATPPGTQTVPSQEAGSLVALPLPYQPNANPLANCGGSFTINLTNAGTASFHFSIFPNANRIDGPWPFDVVSNSLASMTFNVATNGGNYDFTCYGVDNFQRRFAGNIYTNCNQIEVLSQIDPVAGAVDLSLKNLTATTVIFTLTNGYVVNGSTTYSVPANSTNSIVLSTSTNNGLYDVTVTANADSTFVRRLAGHVQVSGTSVNVVSSKNASAYKDNVTFTASVVGYGAPSGTMQFLTNGTPLGSPVTLTNGVAVISTAGLPRGTNIISASYSGDNLNQAFTNTLTQVVTNHPPVAGTANFSRPANLWLPIKVSDLLTNASDVDGDILSLSNVDSLSAQGSVVTNTGMFIDYENATNNVADSFGYTVNDGYGGSATGTVNISVLLGQGPPALMLLSPSTIAPSITFSGAPGYSYVTQRATNLAPPIAWVNVSTNMVNSNGVFQVQDNFGSLANIPLSVYYRLLIQQP